MSLVQGDLGYSRLQSQTVLVAVDLFDTLQFRLLPEPDVQLRIRSGIGRDGRFAELCGKIPTDERNLIRRAVELLRRETGAACGVAIDVIKRIPPESGLGGGSSDAAATLATLNRLWKLHLPLARLRELAAALGSDVPFFLGRHVAAVCHGRGEHVEPIVGPRGLYFVIARPQSGLSTAEVYRRCVPAPRRRIDADWRKRLPAAALPWLARAVWNGLLEPACQLSAAVSETLSLLRQAGGLAVGMSGSGTACFACCRHAGEARALAARIAAQRRFFVAVARTCCAGS